MKDTEYNWYNISLRLGGVYSVKDSTLETRIKNVINARPV